MAFEGLAAVQARISQIQQQFAPMQSAVPLGASGASDPSFAALLEQASSIGSDAQTDTSGGLGGLGDLSALGSGDTSSALLERISSMTGKTASSSKLNTFLQSALAQTGDAYVWGSSAPVSNPDPKAFDCSELVRWAAGRAGVDVPDGSWLQYLDLKAKGATIPVEQALRTPGALLFSFSSEPTPGGGRPSQAHVAISLGDGRTIEARGRKYGVGTWDAGNRFQYGAVVPGLG